MTPTPLPFSYRHGIRRIRVFWQDVRTAWHRARYGWAPSDTWNLQDYLAGVMAGSLKHLAETSYGSPNGYPLTEGITAETPTNHELWKQDLLRWAEACREYALDENDLYNDAVYDQMTPDYEHIALIAKQRNEAFHHALKEMEPWFDSLWS